MASSHLSDWTRLNVGQIFIGNLSPNVTRPVIAEYFELYGKVIEIKVVKDVAATSPVRNFALVTFDNEESVNWVTQNAVHIIGGTSTVVKRAYFGPSTVSNRPNRVACQDIPMEISPGELIAYFEQVSEVIEFNSSCYLLTKSEKGEREFRRSAIIQLRDTKAATSLVRRRFHYVSGFTITCSWDLSMDFTKDWDFSNEDDSLEVNPDTNCQKGKKVAVVTPQAQAPKREPPRLQANGPERGTFDRMRQILMRRPSYVASRLSPRRTTNGETEVDNDQSQLGQRNDMPTSDQSHDPDSDSSQHTGYISAEETPEW